MSYRTVKRVLGETSLERKCRWWFGLSLIVLLTASFTWYGRQTDKLVSDRIKTLSEELVRAGWQKLHIEELAEIERIPRPNQESVGSALYRDLAESSLAMGRQFEWHALVGLTPDALKAEFRQRAEEYLPQDPEEAQLVRDWFANYNRKLPADGDTPEAWKSPTFSRPNTDENGRRVYQYYQPMYADNQSCIDCHKLYGPVPKNRELGELMAVVRVTIDDQETVDALVKNRTGLWVAAIVVGFCSMFSLWAVVRYVIVKPVLHLKDVSDEIARGTLDLRADIRTGDEFEELSHAFNRMLRHLTTVQDELREVNTDLDGKVDELAQVNLRLYEMNKLKDDFLATMSHELRTPLNSILGFSDVLSRAENLSDKQRRFVKNIQTSGRDLMALINDLLDLAKIESGKMELQAVEFSLVDLVERQVASLAPLAERKNIDLSWHVAPELPTVLQDPGKLGQVLNNLLSNAVKFTPEGGRVRVTARPCARPEPARADGEPAKRADDGRAAPGSRDGGWFELMVEDTGIGIPLEDQDTIFEKFRQGRSIPGQRDTMTREYGGTGLGLSIVKELTKLLGGEVLLDSEFGKGSTFTVRLPAQLDESRRQRPGMFDRDLLQWRPTPKTAAATESTTDIAPVAPPDRDEHAA